MFTELSDLEEEVLTALLKNKNDDDRSFLRINDISHKIHFEVHDILERLRCLEFITNCMYSCGAPLDSCYLTKKALNYFEEKKIHEERESMSANPQITQNFYANSITISYTIEQSVMNINNVIEKQCNNDPELISLIEELKKELDSMKKNGKIHENKGLMGRISDALKKHEVLVAPFAQLLASAMASMLGIPI